MGGQVKWVLVAYMCDTCESVAKYSSDDDYYYYCWECACKAEDSGTIIGLIRRLS